MKGALADKVLAMKKEVATRQKKWDLRFLKLAKEVSTWSKDPSTKVGAVVTSENRVLSTGYNGFPRGFDDSKIENRDFKIQHITHAEENALYHLGNANLSDLTIYTWPFQPCGGCAKVIRGFSVVRVVSYESDVERWQDSFKQASEIFEQANIKMDLFPST